MGANPHALPSQPSQKPIPRGFRGEGAPPSPQGYSGRCCRRLATRWGRVGGQRAPGAWRGCRCPRWRGADSCSSLRASSGRAVSTASIRSCSFGPVWLGPFGPAPTPHRLVLGGGNSRRQGSQAHRDNRGCFSSPGGSWLPWRESPHAATVLAPPVPKRLGARAQGFPGGPKSNLFNP